MASAMAARQWPQARVAATRNTKWTKDPTCRLCHSRPGTLEHRLECTAINQQRVHHNPPPGLGAAASTLDEHQRQVWSTRGIRAVRIFTQPQKEDGSVKWIKEFPDHTPFHDATWYTDASLIDADVPSAARFGAAAIAVNEETVNCWPQLWVSHLPESPPSLPPKHGPSLLCSTQLQLGGRWLLTANHC